MCAAVSGTQGASYTELLEIEMRGEKSTIILVQSLV